MKEQKQKEIEIFMIKCINFCIKNCSVTLLDFQALTPTFFRALHRVTLGVFLRRLTPIF